MTEAEFWALMDGLPDEDRADALSVRLQGLSQDALVEYQQHFDRFHGQAYRWDLWNAAYVILGGCSDDSFMDFRYGLISCGRKTYESALRDPDSLASILSGEDKEWTYAEEIGYVANEVFEDRFGGAIPMGDDDAPLKPVGEEWDPEDPELCAQKLPRLWELFGKR